MNAASPDRYAVLGHPVEHSKSPFIHAAFARACGEPVAYGKQLVPLDGFVPAVQAFAASGAKGCNITVPFKHQAFDIAPRRSARATLAQAANLLRFDSEGWWADNTDGVGLVRDITVNAGVAIEGRRVLLIGAGGASAGALGALIEARPRQIVVANRTVEKAQALVARHASHAQAQGVALAATPLSAPGEAFDLVINGSASSLSGDAAPVPATVLRPGGLALDMMYGPPAAGFLHWAQSHGATARDGLGMLVEQAAESFWLWRGVRPETAPVLQALRDQLGAG